MTNVLWPGGRPRCTRQPRAGERASLLASLVPRWPTPCAAGDERPGSSSPAASARCGAGPPTMRVSARCGRRCWAEKGRHHCAAVVLKSPRRADLLPRRYVVPAMLKHYNTAATHRVQAPCKSCKSTTEFKVATNRKVADRFYTIRGDDTSLCTSPLQAAQCALQIAAARPHRADCCPRHDGHWLPIHHPSAALCLPVPPLEFCFVPNRFVEALHGQCMP